MVTATKDKPKNEIPSDGWSPDDMVYITAGNGYCVSPTLATICIGPVDADGKPREEVFKPKKQATENPPDPPDKPPSRKKRVTKLKQVETVGVNDSQSQNGGSIVTPKKKHAGGRPKKKGDDVCRMTKYRREKEAAKQGVLL